MSRPIQVGDFARVILDNETQTYPIEFIEGNTIYLSVEEGESLRLIPLDGEYQVQGLEVNHQVEFLANDTPSLTGLHELDLTLLEELDDKDLETICQVDDYVKELCEGDQLWKNKIVNNYGQGALNQRPSNVNLRNYYYSLDDLYSIEGANIALARNNKELLSLIESIGYQPNIQEYERGPGEAYRPQSIGLFPEDIVAFLREAELGPQVSQDYSRESLPVAIKGTRLNDILWFIHPTINGQPNPFYRFDFYGRNSSVLDLLALHLYYSNSKHESLRNPVTSRRLVSSSAIERNYLSGFFSASNAMRTYLGDAMRTFIDEDVLNVQRRHPELSQQAVETGNLMKEAINNPTLKIRREKYLHIFNPNKLSRDDINRFDKYIRNTTERERTEITPQVEAEMDHVYSIIPGITPDIAFDAISLIIGRVINSAKGFWTMNFNKSRDEE